MSVSPLVSIIVITHNSKRTIRECLSELLNCSGKNCEVVVCDNASTDGTVGVIESEFISVKVIRNESNLGFAEANNIAVSHAKGKYLAFVNPDIYVSDGWLEPLLLHLQNNPNIGSVSPVINHGKPPKMIRSGGNRVYISGLTFLRNEAFDHSGSIRNVIAVSGACFVLARSVFERINGFNQEFFLYHEDTDLSIRINLIGLTHVVLTSVTVTHDYQPSFSPQKIYYLERNRYLTYFSLFPIWTMIFSIVPLALSEMLIWAYCVMSGKAYIEAKAQSWREVKRLKTWLLDRRVAIQKGGNLDFAWLKELSPSVNLQYLNKGFLSRAAEIVLFIGSIPTLVLIRLILLITGSKG